MVKMSMFHVKQFLKNPNFSTIFLLATLFLIPIQTRILYFSDKAYIDWYFNYHLAFFVYLTDLLLILYFTAWIVEHKHFPRFHKYGVLVIAILFWSLLTLFHVKRIDLGIYNFLKLVELLCFTSIIPLILREKRMFHTALWLILVAGIFQAGLALGQFHVKHDLGFNILGEHVPALGTPGLATLDINGEKIIRAYGTMPHPNILAGFLLLPLTIGLYFVSHETDNKKRLILAIFLMLITWGLFLTFSRIAWIGALIIYGSYLTYLFQVKLKKQLILIVFTLVVSCGTLGLVYTDYIVSRGTNVSESQAVADRQTFNQRGLELVAQSPVWGTGIGDLVVALQDRYELEPWQYQLPHNIYILIAAETGIVGLILFLLLFFYILRSTWNLKSMLTFSFLALVIIFLIMGNFDHYFLTIQQGRLTFFATLGLLLATKNLLHEPD